jgi:hypothetical protein
LIALGKNPVSYTGELVLYTLNVHRHVADLLSQLEQQFLYRSVNYLADNAIDVSRKCHYDLLL